MFSSVNPQTFHRFLAPDRRTILALTWRRPETTFRQRLRLALMGGEDPASPRGSVPAPAFTTALALLEGGDVGGAAKAFDKLGYETSVSLREESR